MPRCGIFLEGQTTNMSTGLNDSLNPIKTYRTHITHQNMSYSSPLETFSAPLDFFYEATLLSSHEIFSQILSELG